MKQRLIVKARADLDIVSHYLYLLDRNPSVADRFRQSIKASLKRIQDSPRGCATLALAEFEEVELRFCRVDGFPNYLVIFQVTEDGPKVLRILHSSQDVSQSLHGSQ